LRITSCASLQESRLDACLFTSRRNSRFLHYLAGALRGRHVQYPDVVYRKTERVFVSSQAGVPIQMDGEPAGFLPVATSGRDRGVRAVLLSVKARPTVA
jgi:diacylglycerol kinase family enzyme